MKDYLSLINTIIISITVYSCTMVLNDEMDDMFDYFREYLQSKHVGRYAALGETHVVDTATGDVLFFARKNAIIAENPSNWVLTRISE